MKNLYKLLSVTAFAFFFTSCGTVSDVATTDVKNSTGYSKVVINNFAYRGAASEIAGPASSTTFPNYIQSEISKNDAFSSVTRGGKAGAGTLVISGDVTRYVAGNAALRMLVGFGAGSAYFDADVRFTDGATGKLLGSMKADKNSWGLGGGLAAGQTPETFMQGAAKKVAKESLKFSKNAPTKSH